MAENTTNDLNLLRSLLQTDDDLQIQPSGDFNQICLKLNSDIQISFFIHKSTTSLTIDNLHDLRISNRNSFQCEQWIRIRDYFNQLIQQSDSHNSLYLIIQLIQEKLSESISSKSNEDASTVIQNFHGADLIFNRIAHDPTINRSKVVVGYEDRFTVQLNLKEGIYHFDSAINQWTLCSDIRSEDHMYIPERCQFVTWNILSANSTEQFREILKTLQSFLPDIICLQGVKRNVLNHIFEEKWMKENNYYMIIMESVFQIHENQSYGQLMLMKNFRPQTFQICSVDLFEENWKYIIARFELNENVTIDLINLHLDHSHEQQLKILEYLFNKMNIQNYMIIGDFNFGDEDIIEENILQKSKYQIYDLWKEIYDLDENPGYTFDSIRNTCARITSDSSNSRRRSDRYLLHKLPNLSYSIVHMNMIGLETIVIENKHINQSNHYALQLIIQFRIRTLNHRSALVILPTKDTGYINLICPFFDLIDTEDDEENLLLPLRLLLAQYQSFNIEIDPLVDNHMKLNEQSKKYIQQLTEQIQQLFPQCGLNNHHSSSMTIGQLNNNLALIQSIRYIYILQQLSNTYPIQYHITHQLPLGSVLEPIGFHSCDYISDEIGEFFQRMNLYQDRKFFEQKQEKFDRLFHCFAGVFNKDTVHCFTYEYFPYGSFRLGLHGEDLDTVFVLSEEKNINQKTNLDQILLQLRYDPLALNDRIINLLEQKILENLNQDIIDCRKIQALYPIISIVFNDQTRVEIFVQTILNEQSSEKRNLLSNFYEPIHGVHDIERLITYVRFPCLFQHLLTFIRAWAQNVGIYGQVYGYLGGYSWAILCAYICHRYIPSIQSSFSLEQFFILVEKFFSTYSQFNWSNSSLSLYPNHSSNDTRGSMRILCPSPPFNNSSRSTINSTRYLIIQSFRNACDKTCEDILRLSNRFPDQTIQSIFQLTISGQTTNELNQWIGYMKSRLAHFLTDCEDECNLFVQTDNQIEDRGKSLERYYSLGFQVNEQILSRHREFYYCLNKFLDQFKIWPCRSETMKISFKLMSKNQWDRRI